MEIKKIEHNPKSKIYKAATLLNAGEKGKAFSIFRSFFTGLTKEERKYVERASDILNGKGAFYKALGVDFEETLTKAEEIVRVKYGIPYEC